MRTFSFGIDIIHYSDANLVRYVSEIAGLISFNQNFTVDNSNNVYRLETIWIRSVCMRHTVYSFLKLPGYHLENDQTILNIIIMHFFSLFLTNCMTDELFRFCFYRDLWHYKRQEGKTALLQNFRFVVL